MGNYGSKLLFYTNENSREYNEHEAVVQQATMEDNSMYTPISSEKRVLGDPRSISAGIKRTPIEVKCIPVRESKKTPSAILKYLQKKQYFETDVDVVIPPLTPKKHPVSKSMDSNEQSDFIKIQDYSTPNINVAKSSEIITPTDKECFMILGLDPRSPATDFDRTPILMPKSLALIKARSQENLNFRGSYKIYNPKNSYQKIGTSLNISEIRLSDTISKSLKSLDTEEQDELPSISLYDSDLNISKRQKEVTVIKNPRCMNGEKKSFVSDEQTVTIDNQENKDKSEKQDDCKHIEFNKKIKDDDKIKLWHNSLSSEEKISGKKDKKELLQEKTSRENVIITFDKYTMINTSLKPVKAEKEFQKKRDTKGKKKNTKIDVKFNEEIVITPENKALQGTQVHKNRTPLGNRSNNSHIQKKLQQLRNKTASIGTEQENTPPYKTHNEKIRNGIQWDPNSTVLI